MKRTILFLSIVIASIAIQTRTFAQVIANAGNDTVICNGFSAQLGGNPTATGGTPPYSFLWNPSAGLSSNTISNPILTNHTCGVYYKVTVTDSFGVSDSDSIYIGLDSLVFNLSPSSATICPGTTITISPNIIGGCPPFSYIWADFITYPNVTAALSAGQCMTVSDALGCAASINQATNITIDTFPTILPNNTNSTCPTCADGSIILINPSSALLTYFWSNGATTQNIYGLFPGNYSVSITNANGCSNIYSFTIGVGNCSANFSLVPDLILPHLYNATNLSYGTPPISYVWDWGDGNTSNTAAPSHTYGAEGFYNICLSITDGTGCTSTYCDSTFLLKTSNSIVNIVVIDGTTVDVQEIENNFTKNLSPNPFSTFCNLSFTKPLLNAKLRIYDNLGKEVRQITNLSGKEIKIKKENLKSGIYFLKIEDKNGFVGNGKMVVE
ncbi:MAG: T9SS type A sorting domain-containing protein [Bacteroidetes bacterium]|nr:T9SS type A sorting domain-containing protein [Bacteroidota bacterium]